MLKSLNKKMHIDFKTLQEAPEKTFESEKGKVKNNSQIYHEIYLFVLN
jgi:hypothetical protein